MFKGINNFGGRLAVTITLVAIVALLVIYHQNVYSFMMSAFCGESAHEGKLLLKIDSLQKELVLLNQSKDRVEKKVEETTTVNFATLSIKNCDSLKFRFNSNGAVCGIETIKNHLSPAPSNVVQKKSLAPKKTWRKKSNKWTGKKFSQPKKSNRPSWRKV